MEKGGIQVTVRIGNSKRFCMKRRASAVWNGELKTGKGSISTESGSLSNLQYSFTSRFENGVGTNPEELIAAAHAGCFSMALSNQLGSAGMKPEKIETTATVNMEKLEKGWTVTDILLDVKAKVPGADPIAFDKAAGEAKAGCPISRLLNAKITLKTLLEK
jgi:osmotically inducible protein OsmC